MDETGLRNKGDSFYWKDFISSPPSPADYKVYYLEQKQVSALQILCVGNQITLICST